MFSVRSAHMVATEVVHASVHEQLISCDVSLNLMSERNALGTCEFYEVYRAPVGKAEGGVDAHTVEQILEIRQQVNELVQDIRKSFNRGRQASARTLAKCRTIRPE